MSLGITTLLSMSILMLMVSDQMPTTSTFIPLIGLIMQFYIIWNHMKQNADVKENLSF